jgi:RNA polymerase sigma-70 factor (ECF subfamily)
LAQEAFLRVWQSASKYKPQAKFTTWIYRITVNFCLNELKSAHRKKMFPLGFPGEETQTQEGAGASGEEIRSVFSQYKGKIAVSWYDFESKEGEEFMAKRR